MNIISFQDAPSVRPYLMNVAAMKYDSTIHYILLIEMPGYDKTFEKLGYSFAPPRFWRSKPKTLVGKIYYHFFSERSGGRKLSKLVQEFKADIIHTHNVDHLAYYAIRYTNLPVVHDISDFYSIFPRNQGHPSNKRRFGLWERYRHAKRLVWEKFAFENADGLTFNSPYMLDVAKELYNIRAETAVIPNAVPEEDIPRENLPKLSKRDRQVHAVFVGHINRAKLNRVKELADRDIHVHLYTLHAECFESILLRKCEEHKYLHYHRAVPHRQLLLELTQYDYGLVLWYEGAQEKFFEVSLPSKLFDYLASGLPVIVGPYRALSDFVLSKGCGFVLNHIDELESKLSKTYTVGDRGRYTMEYYVPRLMALYRKIARS